MGRNRLATARLQRWSTPTKESPMRYAALPTQQFPDPSLIELVHRDAPASVTLDSPARSVMIDLSDAKAVTIAPHERLAQAAQRMDQLGVQLLLVVAQMP